MLTPIGMPPALGDATYSNRCEGILSNSQLVYLNVEEQARYFHYCPLPFRLRSSAASLLLQCLPVLCLLSQILEE